MGKPEVLLAGEPANPHSDLAQRLAHWGAQCNFASSLEEVCKLLSERTFDLVICEATLLGGSALRAVPLLTGLPTTLFCSFPIEDMDLAASSEASDEPRNLLYKWHFLWSFKRRMRRKAKLFPERYHAGLWRLRTIRQWY